MKENQKIGRQNIQWPSHAKADDKIFLCEANMSLCFRQADVKAKHIRTFIGSKMNGNKEGNVGSEMAEDKSWGQTNIKVGPGIEWIFFC